MNCYFTCQELLKFSTTKETTLTRAQFNPLMGTGNYIATSK